MWFPLGNISLQSIPTHENYNGESSNRSQDITRELENFRWLLVWIERRRSRSRRTAVGCLQSGGGSASSPRSSQEVTCNGQDQKQDDSRYWNHHHVTHLLLLPSLITHTQTNSLNQPIYTDTYIYMYIYITQQRRRRDLYLYWLSVKFQESTRQTDCREMKVQLGG